MACLWSSTRGAGMMMMTMTMILQCEHQEVAVSAGRFAREPLNVTDWVIVS